MGRGIAAAAAGLLLCCASAQAAPQTVCCFKITMSVSGGVSSRYTQDSPSDDAGDYSYVWRGTAYGIAHLQAGTLITDRGAAAGFLQETDGVKRSDGALRTDHNPGCVSDINNTTGNGFGGAPFEKTSVGPRVDFGKYGGALLSDTLDAFRLKCGGLASETLNILEHDNHHWSSGLFFRFAQLKLPMAGKLADRDAQDVLCVEQASGSASNQTAQGSWALSVKVIPFPADDLKRQQRRLAGNIGKSQPDFGPADKALGSPPSDGCHKQ